MAQSRKKHFPTDKTCPACNKIWRATTRYQITTQNFCSRKCRTKIHGNGRPRNHVIVECHTCGAEVETVPCLLRSKKFCSKRCLGLFRGRFSGENNPSWRGGNAKYWKRKCRERDDFTCQLPECGKRDEGRGIHAHHKIPRKAGGADTLDNLITLCNQHHHEMGRQLLAGLIEKFPEAVREVASKLYPW